jgi:hypothetical protein
MDFTFNDDDLLIVDQTNLGVSKMIEQMTSLPAELRTPENLAKIRKFVKQWTQLIAWEWSEFTAFAASDPELNDEKTLKRYFSSIMERQALHRMAANEYGDPASAQTAAELSQKIKQVLTCEATAPGITLTLADVYKKLTNQEYFFTDPLVQEFRFEVTVDSFTGHIRKDEMNPTGYAAIIAYPARPSLGAEFNEQLKDWMYNQDNGEYLPPSVYIPISAS